MNQFFTSASGLDARGVGPRIILRTAPFLLAAVVAEFIPVRLSGFPFSENQVVKTAGFIWLAAGIILFVASIVQFSRNFPKGKLLQTGMYACSRNPIYSCWILFILPSLSLIFHNWLFLLSAIAMCAATLLLVKEEETQLQKVYGKQYETYKTRVGCIICFPRKKTNEA